MTAQAQVPESGRLSDLALPRILIDLYTSRFTGRLELSRARTRKTFVFQDGAPVGSESSLPAEQLTAVLQDMERLSLEDRRRADDYVREKRCPDGVALLSLELLDPKQLFEAMKQLLRRRILEPFGWADGEFRLAPGDERREDLKPFRVDPYLLVQDGLQAHWSPDRMLQALAPRLGAYASPGARLGKVARRLALDASVERMIAGLNGRQTLGSVIGGAVGSPSALAAFWVIDAAGALAYSETPRQSDEDTAPEIEIEITGSAPAQARTATPRTAAADGWKARSGTDPAAEKMRAEVLERLERLDAMTYYELLGVAPDAEQGAIRKAYFLAAKRYHPDAIARLGLQDIRQQAGEVFSKIAEANGVLADREKRRRYDESLEAGLPEVDVQVLAQAETFYRKGEILINMGDFRGALEYLKNAVHLYPHEAIYQSDLAWAYYKKTPSEPESAFEHIQLALELDPSNAVAQFRLGVIERARV